MKKLADRITKGRISLVREEALNAAINTLEKFTKDEN